MSSTKKIAFASCFAAVYAVLRVLPTFPMFGVPGASFAAADLIAPLYGIILGPMIGPLSIIVGTFLGFFGRPIIFLGLDFLPAAVNALVLGLIMWRRWVVASAIYVIVLVMFMIHPLSLLLVATGGFQFPFHWMHILGLIVLLSPLSRKSVGWIKGVSTAHLAWGVVVLAFIGTLAQHSTGSLLWETVYGMVLRTLKPEAFISIFSVVFWVYPFERIFIVVMATIIGTALVRALKAGRLMS